MSKQYAMKKFILITCLIIGAINFASAQNGSYVLVEAKTVSSDIVRLRINVFCKDKQQIATEAQCAAIRAVLFEGTGVPPYTKPLLSEGEQTMKQSYPYYFDNLFSTRYSDFIRCYSAISKFKRSENKSTLYEVDVKILLLRKDLEKNRIKRQIGY